MKESIFYFVFRKIKILNNRGCIIFSVGEIKKIYQRYFLNFLIIPNLISKLKSPISNVFAMSLKNI